MNKTSACPLILNNPLDKALILRNLGNSLSLKKCPFRNSHNTNRYPQEITCPLRIPEGPKAIVVPGENNGGCLGNVGFTDPPKSPKPIESRGPLQGPHFQGCFFGT